MATSETHPLLNGSAKKQRTKSALKSYFSVPADSNDVSSPRRYPAISRPNIAQEGDFSFSNESVLVDEFAPNETTGIAKYITLFQWLPKYKLKNLPSDFLAGLTLTAFQIPMVLSLSHLANCSPKSGLYSLIFPPLVYALIGNNCHELVIGPQILPSLAVSEAISQINLSSASQGVNVLKKQSLVPVSNIVGVISFTSGLILLYVGLSGQGYLDNIMSRSFQRGLISSLAIIVFVNSLLQQLDLNKLFKEWLVENHIHGVGSSWEKCAFVWHNLDKIDMLTFKISLVSLIFLIGTRIVKNRYMKKHQWLIFFPEILLFVIVSTVLSSIFKWDLPLVGELLREDNRSYLMNPLKNIKLFKDTFYICIFVSAVGLFESAAAYKSLNDMDGKTTREISSNKEISVIGIANLVCGLFSSLPSFAGYGRTKLNCMSGCKSPLAGVIIAVLTTIITKFFLVWFSNLPECSLSCVISYISYTLLEELPRDIVFYMRVRGYREIFLVFLIIFLTIIWSPQMAISVGLIISMSSLLKQTTKSKISVLGKDLTTNKFKPIHLHNFGMKRTMSDSSSIAEGNIPFLSLGNTNLEFEKIMIVETPRTLNFANISDVKKRLIKLEKYGPNSSSKSKANLLKSSAEDDEISILTGERTPLKYLILDLENLLEIDISALLTLSIIMTTYSKRDIFVFFTQSYRTSLDEKFKQSGIFHHQRKKIDRWLIRFHSLVYDNKELYSALKGNFFESVEQCVDCIDSMEYIENHA
ncbi:hypothetical protein QEN19_004095 [Hanseniaspora menglaensis]